MLMIVFIPFKTCVCFGKWSFGIGCDVELDKDGNSSIFMITWGVGTCEERSNIGGEYIYLISSKYWEVLLACKVEHS